MHLLNASSPFSQDNSDDLGKEHQNLPDSQFRIEQFRKVIQAIRRLKQKRFKTIRQCILFGITSRTAEVIRPKNNIKAGAIFQRFNRQLGFTRARAL